MLYYCCLDTRLSLMTTPDGQVPVFSGGRPVNVWLPHKKYSPTGAHGAPRKKAFFKSVGVPQVGPPSIRRYRLTGLLPAPQWLLSHRVPSSAGVMESSLVLDLGETA